MKPILVVVNPNAGRGRTRALWPRIEAALRDAGVAFEAVETRRRGEAADLAAAAAGTRAGVVAVGGDGTAHEVVNGLMRASSAAETIPMGVIPAGSGDDFAKTIPPRPPVGGRARGFREAAEGIASGATALLDVGVATRDGGADSGARFFVNNLDVGFGAQGAVNMASIPRFLKGTTAYVATALKTLVDYPRLEVRLAFDGGAPEERSTTMTAIMNGRCLGGGFWVAPSASADDGLFDVMVVDAIGRAAIAMLIPRLMKGTHEKDRAVSTRRAARVVVESRSPFAVTADGEIPWLDARRIEAAILPRRLRVFRGGAGIEGSPRPG